MSAGVLSVFHRPTIRKLPTLEAIEVIEAVLLSLATILTAWSAFQAAAWDGDQSSSFARADALQAESVKATNLATVQVNVDTVLFDRWVAARSAGDSTLTAAIESSMRPALRAALHAWETDGGIVERAGAPSSPLQEGGLLDHDLAQADAFIDQAKASTHKAEHANNISDYFILVTVLLALVLFVVGIASKLRGRNVRLGLAGFATICLVAGVVVLVALPSTWP